MAEPVLQPAPVARPHPKILIGGGGEKRTLRLVATYADACNLFAESGSPQLQRKLDVLRRHCDEVGRDYESIERTSLGQIDGHPGEPSELVTRCRSLSALGIQHHIVSLMKPSDLRALEAIGRGVIPSIADL
jgi:alkanesulfonate monooxygenase